MIYDFNHVYIPVYMDDRWEIIEIEWLNTPTHAITITLHNMIQLVT